MTISVAGINHKSAPVRVREKYALSEGRARRFIRSCVRSGLFREALVLNTCNRTEVYYVAVDGPESPSRLFARMTGRQNGAAEADREAFYEYTGLGAVSHLFSVAASLDSQLVGEDEILGQLKDAYSLAHSAGTTNVLLNELLHRAFRVGKRVRNETTLNQGSASVPRAAVELGGQIFSTLENKRILLLGAGETAQMAVHALLEQRPQVLALANRTRYRARDLLMSIANRVHAAQAKASACPLMREELRNRAGAEQRGRPLTMPRTYIYELEDIPEVIGDFDLVLCSTGSPSPLITHEACAPALKRLTRPLLIIDIAVPRDVDETLKELPEVFLCDIDDLNRLVEKNLDRRRREVPRARAIVEDEVEKFSAWLDTRRVVPTIKLLKTQLEEIREAEVRKYGKNFHPADHEELRKFARSLCQKLLHHPVSYLRRVAEQSDNGEHAKAAALVRQIFDLGREEESREAGQEPG